MSFPITRFSRYRSFQLVASYSFNQWLATPPITVILIESGLDLFKWVKKEYWWVRGWVRWVKLTWSEHGDGTWVGAWQFLPAMASWMKIRILHIRINVFFWHYRNTCYIISFYIWAFYNPDPSLHKSCVDNKWLSLQRWDRAPHMTRGSPRQQQSNTSHPSPPSFCPLTDNWWQVTHKQCSPGLLVIPSSNHVRCIRSIMQAD